MSEPKWAPDTPITDALIQKVMDEHPGVSKHAQAVYYEEVHQELAPLARQFERELTALRSQVAELQQQYEKEAVQHNATLDLLLSVQRERDEAAKQEPVGEVVTEPFGDNDICVLKWAEHYDPAKGDKLYAKPINLPALLEQAKAEEREECARICKESLMDGTGAITAAIRARKP